MTEITSYPYPVTYQDDSSVRFTDKDDSIFIEVRKTEVPRPLDSLAIHYTALFPGGEIIRPGDNEEYVKINGKNAYKVVFQTKYIRKRKRMDEKAGPNSGQIPPGWTSASMEDPITGKRIRVLLGPSIPEQRILYLVQGDSYIYYIFWKAEGESIEPSRKKFEEFVRQDISYR